MCHLLKYQVATVILTIDMFWSRGITCLIRADYLHNCLSEIIWFPWPLKCRCIGR